MCGTFSEMEGPVLLSLQALWPICRCSCKIKNGDCNCQWKRHCHCGIEMPLIVILHDTSKCIKEKKRINLFKKMSQTTIFYVHLFLA